MNRLITSLMIVLLVFVGFMLGFIFAASPISLTVDGIEVGCDPAPTIIRNKVFVPIRCVSEALGYPVRWDSAKRRVEIGVPPEGLDMVLELPPFKVKDAQTLTSVTVSGIRYNKGFIMPSYSELSWNLSGKFSKMSFLVGMMDNSQATRTNKLKAYGDGKDIGTIPEQTTAEGIKSYEVDISGINILEIKTDFNFGSTPIISPRAYK